MNKRRIYISSDHAGYELKELIIKEFEGAAEIDIIDLGTDSSTISVDYPDFALKLANEVNSDESSFGIGICGTGIGICIALNKINNIRAALVYSKSTAKLGMEHDKANVIVFGSREMEFKDVIEYINIFKSAKFEERHQKRIDKISDLERKN